MIVKLFDKTEIAVNHEQASKITKAMARGVKVISINGNTINTSAIASVMTGGYTQPDVIDDKSHLLDKPDFRGRPSPNKEKLRQQVKELKQNLK